MAVAPSSVNQTYEKVIMRRSHELMDFTNYKALRRSLKLTFLATIDSLVWGFYNLWIFLLFFCCTWIWPFVETFVKFLKIISYREGIVYRSPNHHPGSKNPKLLALSAVNAIDPNFHSAYRPDWSKIQPLLTRAGSHDKQASFNFDLAEFLLHLSALAYESNELVSDMITYWNDPALDLRYCRFGHEGLIMVVLYSIPGQFVVVAFKGTSPFDLTEWLTDCSLRKTAANNSLLPGLVHCGFYEVFGFPKEENVTRFDMDPKEHTPIVTLESGEAPPLEGLGASGVRLPPVENNARSATIRRCVEAFQSKHRNISGARLTREGFWEHIESEFRAIVKKFAAAGAKKPSLIMTGHSLGGATASMFSSLLLWRRTGSPSSVVRLNWDACFRLEGCLTFGTPRPGDSTWSEAIEAVRISQQWTPSDQPLFYAYRVISGSDFIATCPISPMIDFRWKVDWDQPQRDGLDGFLSLLDSRHYGTPILLHVRSSQQQFKGTYSKRERALSDIVPNYLGALRSFHQVLRRGSWTNVVLGFLRLFVIPSILIDHAPVEYAANMGRPTTPL